MIRTVHKISTVLVLGIGIVHTAATLLFYPALTESAVWFAGAGLGGIFVALLNVALWPRTPPASSWRLAGVANVLFLAWLVLGVSATPGGAQFAVAGVGALMVLSAFWLHASSR